MEFHRANWGKTIFWGAATGVLYTLLFSFSGDILHLAHTTPDACVIHQGDQVIYLHQATPQVCAAKGGEFTPGHWLHALLPVLVAFAISYVHGAFTGWFWDSMGLKAASSKH